jgi:hypothetical protein
LDGLISLVIPQTGELQNLFHRLIRVRGGHDKACVIRPGAYDEFVDDVLYPCGALSDDCNESNAITTTLLDKGSQ